MNTPFLQPWQAREQALKALMLQALAGDERAYRQCLLGLSGHLRAFVRRRLARDTDEVEDLVQDTLLAVHNRRHTYDPALPLTAWVQGIAQYKVADWYRGHGARVPQHDPLDSHELLFADDDTDAREAKRDLRQLLASLPDRWRVPIERTKLDGESVAEAALATGMSESAIKVGVHRGLQALARLIKERA